MHPEYLQAGTQATLTCIAGPSNPPVEISWLRGGFKLNGHLEEIQDAPNKGNSPKFDFPFSGNQCLNIWVYSILRPI